MPKISITTIEAAINFWRNSSPSDDVTFALCPEARALATIYAMMIYNQTNVVDEVSLTDEQKKALDTGHA